MLLLLLLLLYRWGHGCLTYLPLAPIIVTTFTAEVNPLSGGSLVVWFQSDGRSALCFPCTAAFARVRIVSYDGRLNRPNDETTTTLRMRHLKLDSASRVGGLE